MPPDSSQILSGGETGPATVTLGDNVNLKSQEFARPSTRGSIRACTTAPSPPSPIGQTRNQAVTSMRVSCRAAAVDGIGSGAGRVLNTAGLRLKRYANQRGASSSVVGSGAHGTKSSLNTSSKPGFGRTQEKHRRCVSNLVNFH